MNARTPRRLAIVSTLALAATGVASAPAFAGQVVKEPGFVSVNASCTGVAHALLSHFVGNVGTITSGIATSSPGAVSAVMTTWAHEHGDQVFCVGPE
jgi:hypothetical protein